MRVSGYDLVGEGLPHQVERMGGAEGVPLAAPGESAGHEFHHWAEVGAEADGAQARAARQAAIDGGLGDGIFERIRASP